MSDSKDTAQIYIKKITNASNIKKNINYFQNIPSDIFIVQSISRIYITILMLYTNHIHFFKLI